MYFQDSESVLTHCIKIQNVEAVEVLLRCGVDPNHHNRKGVAPISAAAHKGNLTIMSLLIKCGAHVNAINQSGSTALIQVKLLAYFRDLGDCLIQLSCRLRISDTWKPSNSCWRMMPILISLM